jgi:hypothetical protein
MSYLLGKGIMVTDSELGILAEKLEDLFLPGLENFKLST